MCMGQLMLCPYASITVSISEAYQNHEIICNILDYTNIVRLENNGSINGYNCTINEYDTTYMNKILCKNKDGYFIENLTITYKHDNFIHYLYIIFGSFVSCSLCYILISSMLLHRKQQQQDIKLDNILVIDNNIKLTDNNCVICCDELKTCIVKLKCNHFYHKDCIKTWIKIKALCPLCNDKILVD